MKFRLLLLALTVGLYGCSGGSSSSSSSPASATSDISGAVVKGPVAGATVNVFQMDSSGQAVGDPVAGPITTAADGSWSVSIPNSVDRPLLVSATGGSYTDEATGSTVNVATRKLNSFLTAGATTASISPLSETVVRRARQFLVNNPGSTLDESVGDGVAKVEDVFGQGFDPLEDIPDANGTTPEALKAAAILGGLSELASSVSPGTDPLDTVLAISEDVTDGAIDGQSGGQAIEINGTEGNLVAVTTDDYVTAVADFTSNPDNGDFSELTSFKVTAVVSGGNGSVTPGEVALFSGDSASFTLTPAEGSQISDATGCAGTLSGSQFQTDALTGTCELSASFSLIPYTVTVTDVTGGTASVESVDVLFGQTTDITFTEDTGFALSVVEGCGGSLNGNVYTTGPITGDCTVSPSYVLEDRTVTLASNIDNVTFDPVGPDAVVSFGQQLLVTITPEPGFVLDSATGCDGSLDGDLYTISAVTENCTVTATLSAAPVAFTVTGAATGPGTISPTSVQVAQGESTDLALTPNADASLTSVSGCGGAQDAGDSLLFVTGPITADCTVSAVFDPIYTVTVNVGANGSAGPTTVEALNGEQPEITITPDGGFEIGAVAGNCGGTLNGTVYTVDPVAADCSVDITFVESETPLPDAVWGSFIWDEAKWQ